MSTLVVFAALVGQPTHSATGAHLLGGHTGRVTGTQVLAAYVVEVSRIRILAPYRSILWLISAVMLRTKPITATMAAIATSLQRISQLVTDFPEIVEMDINPFMVGQLGKPSTAADARITLKPQDK